MADEILCEIHSCALKYEKITVGTIPEGWYCDKCQAYYTDGSPWLLSSMTYNGRELKPLTREQRERADALIIKGVPTEPKSPHLPAKREKCIECRESFIINEAEQKKYAAKNQALPKLCPKCRAKKDAEEKSKKYIGTRETMTRDNTRHVDTRGRVVHRTGSDFKIIDSVFIPENSK